MDTIALQFGLNKAFLKFKKYIFQYGFLTYFKCFAILLNLSDFVCMVNQFGGYFLLLDFHKKATCVWMKGYSLEMFKNGQKIDL
jgi:hypothetical protein